MLRKYVFIIIPLSLFLVGCSNDVKEVNVVSDTPKFYPLNEQLGATITYSDSGQKVLEIHPMCFLGNVSRSNFTMVNP
jgi:hypothetical protein